MGTFRLAPVLALASLCNAQPQDPNPQNAITAVVRAFDHHNLVLFGEAHGCRQEYEWLAALVNNAQFSDRVDDIVVESGNSLYQQAVDSYISGEDVPFARVELAWRDAIGMINAPSPVHELLFQAVRAANVRRRGKHQMRIVLGGPAGDWDKIRNRDDLAPLLQGRDAWYARRVSEEVLAKKRRALLIMGSLHFERLRGPGLIERQLRAAGASTYLIVFSTKIYEDPGKRLATWPMPAIVELNYNSDAVLVLAPTLASLTVLAMPREELEGTPYGKELERRMMIMRGQHLQIPDAGNGLSAPADGSGHDLLESKRVSGVDSRRA